MNTRSSRLWHKHVNNKWSWHILKQRYWVFWDGHFPSVLILQLYCRPLYVFTSLSLRSTDNVFFSASTRSGKWQILYVRLKSNIPRVVFIRVWSLALFPYCISRPTNTSYHLDLTLVTVREWNFFLLLPTTFVSFQKRWYVLYFWLTNFIYIIRICGLQKNTITMFYLSERAILK